MLAFPSPIFTDRNFREAEPRYLAAFERYSSAKAQQFGTSCGKYRFLHNQEKAMIAAAQHLERSVDFDWLTSRTFTFAAEGAPTPISETFCFHRNGFIVGYSHPNERFWSLENGRVNIIDHLGNVTCSMAAEINAGGRTVLCGAFLNPQIGYAANGARHLLVESESDFHTRIQSFDLFDTLVARLCYDPLQIFRNVGAKAGLPTFASARHSVEMAMFGKTEYGLDDIYRELIRSGIISQQQAAVLKQMELQEEWDNLFPIEEVVAHVNADDIIISDMYLPYDFVKRILVEKCGLENKLYLSNYGKHHLHIWPKLKDVYTIGRHYGDNVHADIIGPSKFGVQPVLVSISKWSKTEEVLSSIGLGDYAKALRKTRLQIPHGDPTVVNAMKAQVAINLPLILLGSVWLLGLAKQHNATSILTCARDCHLLHKVLTSSHFIRSGLPRAHYIAISRTLCRDGGDDYEAYLRNKSGDGKALLVDLVGTGQSLTHLIARRELLEKLQPCIVVADPLSHHFAAVTTFVQKDFSSIRFFVEAMNICDEGSAVGTKIDRELSSIVYRENEYVSDLSDIMRASSRLAEQLLQNMEDVPALQDLPSLDALTSAADAVLQQMDEHRHKMMRSVRHHSGKLAAIA